MTDQHDTTSEQFRHECECRDWLRRGFTTKYQVDQLIGKIAKQRGQAAAERVRQGMREEYRRQQEANKRGHEKLRETLKGL